MNKEPFEATHQFAGPCPICGQDLIEYNAETGEARCAAIRVFPQMDDRLDLYKWNADPASIKPVLFHSSPCWKGRIEIHEGAGIRLVPL